MRRFFAIDTGSTRNASALVGVEEEGNIWTTILLRRWQGTQTDPLDHRNVIGPEMADLVLALDGGAWMGDAFEQGPMRLVSRDKGLAFSVQGGDLFTVYKHGADAIKQGRVRIAVSRGVDIDLWREVQRGLAAVQVEPRPEGPRAWLPADGKSHHDLTSAWLRAHFFGDAGGEPTSGAEALLNLNRNMPTWEADLEHVEEI